MYCIDGVGTLKNRKPTLKYSRKTGFKKNNAKNTFGVDLAKVSDKFGELVQSLSGAPATVLAVC